MIGGRGLLGGGRGRAILASALVVSTAACSSGSSPSAVRKPVTKPNAVVGGAPLDPALREPAGRGAAALARLLTQMDPASLSIPDYLARRFDWPELAGAGALARRMLRADDAGSSGGLGRLVDPAAPAPTQRQLAGAPDYEVVIADALVCRSGSDPSAQLPAAIRRVAAQGGYPLTHAAVALGIAHERRCMPAADDVLRRDLVTALRAEADAATVVDDLAIERLAMLAFLGEPLPEGPVRAVVAAQRPDGSWVDPANRVPSWHPTMLAVWALSAAADRGAAVPFLPDATSARSDGDATESATATSTAFTPAEAQRVPPLDRADRLAIATLARDPAPSAHDQHDMALAMEQVGPVAAITPTDPAAVRELERESSAARRFAATVDRPADAAQAGYRLASRFLPGIGAHWVDWSRVTRPFAARSPAMLLFDGNGSDAHLVGLSYLVRSAAEPDGFRAAGAVWHRHDRMCVVRGVLVGEHSSRRRCRSAQGVLIPGRDLWMLHAWVVPGRENAWGMFAPMNPGLCDVERPCTPPDE